MGVGNFKEIWVSMVQVWQYFLIIWELLIYYLNILSDYINLLFITITTNTNLIAMDWLFLCDLSKKSNKFLLVRKSHRYSLSAYATSFLSIIWLWWLYYNTEFCSFPHSHAFYAQQLGQKLKSFCFVSTSFIFVGGWLFAECFATICSLA